MKQSKINTAVIKTETKVALYCRSNGTSSDPVAMEQVERTRGFVSEFLKVKKISRANCVEFFDFESSAHDMDRPQLQALLRAVEANKIDVVIVADVSRFARRTTDFLNILDAFRKNGVRCFLGNELQEILSCHKPV